QSIRQSKKESARLREENERLRKEDREENERLRKEDREENRRLMEEDREHAFDRNTIDKIHDWTKQLVEFAFSSDIPRKLDDFWGLEEQLFMLRLRSLDVQSQASVFKERLGEGLSKVIISLNEYSGVLSKVREQIRELQGDITPESFLEIESTKSSLNKARNNAWHLASYFSQTIIELRTDLKL
ncbi:unnamed protein product, partial [marine sediment metagenome]